MRDVKANYTVMDAKAATGVGNAIFVRDYRTIVLEVSTANSASLTLKFQGAITETAPDFAAAQSVSNMWDFTSVIDLEDGTSLDGDTGLVLTGTDDYRLFEVNVDGLEWFSARITARAAGAVTIKLKSFE